MLTLECLCQLNSTKLFLELLHQHLQFILFIYFPYIHTRSSLKSLCSMDLACSYRVCSLFHLLSCSHLLDNLLFRLCCDGRYSAFHILFHLTLINQLTAYFVHQYEHNVRFQMNTHDWADYYCMVGLGRLKCILDKSPVYHIHVFGL